MLNNFCKISSSSQVTLWKESLEGQWACISDVNKGQGQNADRPSSG